MIECRMRRNFSSGCFDEVPPTKPGFATALAMILMSCAARLPQQLQGMDKLATEADSNPRGDRRYLPEMPFRPSLSHFSEQGIDERDVRPVRDTLYGGSTDPPTEVDAPRCLWRVDGNLFRETSVALIALAGDRNP